MPRRFRTSSPASTPARDDGGPDHWPDLEEEPLLRSRGRRLRLSCQWFAHHTGTSWFSHGQHLSHRSASWREPLQHQQEWAPELG
jgi:hypothetical protein